MLQVISILGAFAILAAYAANQFRLLEPSNLSYTLLNVLGTLVLGGGRGDRVPVAVPVA
jgi:hypothetical protein